MGLFTYTEFRSENRLERLINYLEMGNNMRIFGVILLVATSSFLTFASSNQDKQKIDRAVRDYIESQHHVDPSMMKRGIDPQLAKRTYWRSKQGEEFVMHSSYKDMLELAATYNQSGDKFPTSPKVEIKIYDIDQRVASVKLIADDWIDYMHLYKNDQEQWKIINVLWQFNQAETHTSEKHK